jgi:hypothetical protein
MDKNADTAAFDSLQADTGIVWRGGIIPSGGALHEAVVVQTKVSGISQFPIISRSNPLPPSAQLPPNGRDHEAP